MVEGNIFDELEDRRQDWKVLHSMTEIMMVVMCGVSAGEMTVHGIHAFAEIKKEWLKKATGLTFENGLPSYDTIRRALGIINPKSFHALFIRWAEGGLGRPVGSYVSFDGKTVRGSGSKEDGIEPLHLLHAYSHELGLVIGQMECTRDKTNEITVSRALFDALKLENAVVTADAMMCQKEFAKKITAGKKNNGYVLAVKGNHVSLEADVRDFFKCDGGESRKTFKTLDKGHGRIEKRTCTLDTNVDWYAECGEWKGLAAFGKCESRVTITKSGKDTTDTRYFITTLTDVERFAEAARSHWAIENNLHWSLDVIFKEDESPVTERNTAENLAIVRRIIYNRIKMQPDYDTLSFGRRACMYDDDFRARILFSC